MGRKCSNCGKVGHNSRTCSLQKEKLRGRFKLFGVQLDGALPSSAMLKKSFSLDSLPSSSSSSISTPSSSSSSSSSKLATGYLSDGLITKTHERKKGVPWSEEEHRVFLVGLEKLGKGDWRGISRKFVTTRTPTQVASHAQKYFLRLTTLTKRSKHRRPCSLFHPARDKFTVKVVESSNSKSIFNNLPASSISFGIIPSNKYSNSTPINIAKSNAAHSVPIWFGNNYDQPLFKFQQSPIKSSSSIKNHFDGKQAPDLQLSLSTPKPIIEQAEPCCRSIPINGAFSVT